MSWMEKNGGLPKVLTRFKRERKRIIPPDEKRHLSSLSLVVPNNPFSKNRRVREPIWDLPDFDKFEHGCDCQQPSDTSDFPNMTGARPNKANHLTTVRSKQIATLGIAQRNMPLVNQSTTTSFSHSRSASTPFQREEKRRFLTFELPRSARTRQAD